MWKWWKIIHLFNSLFPFNRKKERFRSIPNGKYVIMIAMKRRLTESLNYMRLGANDIIIWNRQLNWFEAKFFFSLHAILRKVSLAMRWNSNSVTYEYSLRLTLTPHATISYFLHNKKKLYKFRFLSLNIQKENASILWISTEFLWIFYVILTGKRYAQI